MTTQLCNGFAGVNAGVANGFAQAEIAANGRQMANMNQAFAAQTAMTQGFNGLQSQFADCCCENRLGLADLKYTVATENCADRTQSMQNTRDIINIATMQASQAAQTAVFQQGLNDEVDALYNRLNTCPVPTTPVYGRTPIFTCNNGCGCGCGNNF